MNATLVATADSLLLGYGGNTPVTDYATVEHGTRNDKPAKGAAEDKFEPLVSSLEQSLPIAIHYYPLDEVSRRPQVVVNVEYSPPELDSLEGSGTMVLLLYIGKTGDVDKVETIESHVDDPITAILVAQFRAMKFSPAEKAGEAVASKMRIEVMLRPRLGAGSLK